jgi:TRAP-type uncharacterized transport system substrate-binding protein
MKRRSFLATVLALSPGLEANFGWAQKPIQTAPPMVVSSGGTTGTYYRLMKEFDEAAPGLIINRESDGSQTNIDRVMNNEAELGITQFDTLYFRALKENNLKDHIRILALLHSEEIHFIAKSSARHEGGIKLFGYDSGVNSHSVMLNSIADLRGRKVGVWGGSVITEQIIASIALTGWNPVEFPDQTPAFEALQTDQVDALLAVGGQPLEWVAALSHDYKLLEVSDAVATRLGPVYDKTTLTYRNLDQDGVPSLAVRAMLVTRNYASQAKHDQLQRLHNKLVDVVADLRETRGTHAKWEEIDPTATTDKWPMYLSGTGATSRI